MEGESQESINVSEPRPSTDVFRPSSMGVKVHLLEELFRRFPCELLFVQNRKFQLLQPSLEAEIIFALTWLNFGL